MPIPHPPLRRRRLLWLGWGVVAGLTLGYLFRVPLAGYAIGYAFRQAGAGDVRFRVTGVTPRTCVIEDLGFQLKAQPLSARRVTIARPHWWSPRLGDVRVEGAVASLATDGPIMNPAGRTETLGQGTPLSPAKVAALPLDRLSVSGTLRVLAADLPAHELKVDFTANRDPDGSWKAGLQTTAEGLVLHAEGRYQPASERLDFRVTKAELRLPIWKDFLWRQFAPPGSGDWDVDGVVSATAEGHYTGGKGATTGVVQLRGGRVANSARHVAAEGVEADFDFTDLVHLRSRPGSLRVAELRSGDVRLTNVNLAVAVDGPDRVEVSRAVLDAFGGHLAAEPFGIVPSRREVEAVVIADGLDVEQILAATHDVPARATGRVNGRLPLRVDQAGIRFGTGWMELKRGVQAEIQLQAAGLLTGGMAPGGAGYAVLKKVESGLLRLRVDELRLDIRPPDGPPDRTATLHLAGEPVDPSVKAPVILDVNVNGPLEKLLNFGLDSRLSFDPGK